MSPERNEMEEMKLKLTKWFEQKLPEAKNIVISEFERPGMGLSSGRLVIEGDMNLMVQLEDMIVKLFDTKDGVK